jgi:anti-anti-sigma factor
MSAAPELRTSRAGRAVVVKLGGEIDRLNAPALRAAIERAADSETEAVGVVCDLVDVRYLDSSGVHLLHALSRFLRRRGQRLAVVRPLRRTPAEVLALTGIAETAPVLEDLDAAVAAVAG